MANPLLLGSVLSMGQALIERFFPDKEKQAEAERQMMLMMAQGELQTVLAQLEINAREASHPSIWTSGWRPFFGWGLGTLLLYHYMVREWIVWAFMVWAPQLPPPPSANVDEILFELMFGLLGIAGMRSFEKVKRVTK